MIEDPWVPAHEAKVGYKGSVLRDVHILIDVCLPRQMRDICCDLDEYAMYH